MRLFVFAPLLGILAALAACGGGDETEIRIPASSPGAEAPGEELMAVRDIRVGSAVEEGRGVTREVDSFGPGDTVFVSVEIEGSVGKASVTARWMRADGAPGGEKKRFLNVAGKRIVVFRLAPLTGFAPGRYRLELLLGGQRAGEKAFTVRG